MKINKTRYKKRFKNILMLRTIHNGSVIPSYYLSTIDFKQMSKDGNRLGKRKKNLIKSLHEKEIANRLNEAKEGKFLNIENLFEKESHEETNEYLDNPLNVESHPIPVDQLNISEIYLDGIDAGGEVPYVGDDLTREQILYNRLREHKYNPQDPYIPEDPVSKDFIESVTNTEIEDYKVEKNKEQSDDKKLVLDIKIQPKQSPTKIDLDISGCLNRTKGTKETKETNEK